MTKFLFATMLALGMSSVAFAGEGGHDAFAQSTPGVVIANPPASFDVGSAAYPELPRAYAFAPTGEDVIEAQGREGIVQTANSLPRGALEGTVQYAQQQSINRYFAQQAARSTFAAAHRGTRLN